jgi:hypothetical protein
VTDQIAEQGDRREVVGNRTVGQWVADESLRVEVHGGEVDPAGAGHGSGGLAG